MVLIEVTSLTFPSSVVWFVLMRTQPRFSGPSLTMVAIAAEILNKAKDSALTFA